MKWSFIIFSLIYLSSCSLGQSGSNSSAGDVSKNFYFVGPSNYPSIQSLQPVQNYIFSKNSGASELKIEELSSQTGISATYSSTDPLCVYPSVPAGKSCLFRVVYTPMSTGEFIVTYKFNSNSISLGFSVVASPSLVIDNGTVINMGNVRAGSSFNQIIRMHNSGDISSGFFLADLPSFASVVSTTCGYSIPPRGSCEVTLKLNPKTRATSVNSQFSIRSESQNITFNITGRVLAGDPYGEIFPEIPLPSSLRPSDGEILVETKFITDEYGNIVEDGTPVYVFFSDIEVLDTPSGVLQSNPYYLETANGKISFRARVSASISTTKQAEIRINSGISELFRIITVSP